MSLESFLEKRNTRLSWRVASHLLFWLLFYLAFAYYTHISFNPFKDSPYAYLAPIHNTIGLALVFYTLVYGIFPKLISKKRWFLSVLSLVILTVIFGSITYLGEVLLVDFCPSCKEVIKENDTYYLEYLDRGFAHVMISRLFSLGILLQLFVNLMIPLVIKVGLGYHQSYIRNLKLAQDNVQLELSFLKAQLNPHFLFNTLNNLYGLIIQEKTNESAQTVSRLSHFMRYTLHDSSEQQVAFEKELELIKNYIELEQLRLNQTQVKFTTDLDKSVQKLPPLLLLPLIENAFKYVNDDEPGSIIELDLKVLEGQLDFSVKNSFNPDQDNPRIGGIGLTNLKKRLQLHFPGKYNHTISQLNSFYNAHLNLKFK
ncbi:MAG: hypothetical protein Roseis2KO_31580 [Roseivirga sp.]